MGRIAAPATDLPEAPYGEAPAGPGARLAALAARPFLALSAARRGLFVWVPVCLSSGIGPWFALAEEPGPPVYAALLLALLAALFGWLRGPEIAQIPAAALALMLGGFLLAGARGHGVAEPVLPFRYYGPVEGRIVGIDRSYSDHLRVTLDRVVLRDVPPHRTPAKVRVALHGEQGYTPPEPGLTVILTGHLAPPEGPALPGGFDFQRFAWFSGLGAVGYTRVPMLVLEPPAEDDWAVAAHRARMRASAAIQARIEGQAGAFAAALMTGDRSGITSATNDSMRASNLFHIISISGLHMGMLAGFVFATMRYGLALVPAIALRLPVKKLAAWVALFAATAYMWLAGPNVATERAYVMAAVMLIAVLVDRRAISLRTLAVSAVILLLREPESLTEPGFQMSFGATAALILAWGPWQAVQGHVPALLRPVAALVVSSLAAGMTTAPIAAAHFNRMAEYGLLANMLAVPVMGTLVMPAGVIAAVLAPLGLAGLPLWVMEIGCLWILWVSDWVAGLDGAVVAVPSPQGGVLALMAAGSLLAVLARGPPRWGGVAVLALSALLWAGSSRPPLLVSSDGALLGLMGPEGRALSHPRGAGYVADSWLEDDGDMALQDQAAARPGFTGPKGAREAVLAGVPIRQLTGKAAPEALPGACTGGALVILAGDAPEGWGAGRVGSGEARNAQPVSQDAPSPALRSQAPDCDLWDRRRLRRTGSLAIWPDPAGGLRIVTAREVSGNRLWNSR
ncbi:hypothetical protein GCM10011341_08680 [Frigidibacter albus]|nr:ComEC/Rec2 family competence protein [Frigidibacter albus]GGH47502.1 hypothetical protein GCM10011341_08680 [Frigidibacter albus]